MPLQLGADLQYGVFNVLSIGNNSHKFENRNK